MEATKASAEQETDSLLLMLFLKESWANISFSYFWDLFICQAMCWRKLVVSAVYLPDENRFQFFLGWQDSKLRNVIQTLHNLEINVHYLDVFYFNLLPTILLRRSQILQLQNSSTPTNLWLAGNSTLTAPAACRG